MHAGRPQRVQRRPASRPGWRKHVAVCGDRGGWGRAMVRLRLRPSGESPVSASPVQSAAMAWDFETEPEFQAEAGLDGGLRPRRDLPARDAGRRSGASPEGREALPADHRSAEGGGQAPGPVGRPPAAGHGRARLRPGEARPDARDPRPDACTARASSATTRPTRQRRADRRRRHRRAEGAVDAAAARRQVPLVLLDDRARRRRRPDAAHDDGRARRRRVGDQRAQVVLVERLDRRLPHRDGAHRRRRDARRTSRSR